jgi:glycosyltransferase involved in cell wall biosynthesis
MIANQKLYGCRQKEARLSVQTKRNLRKILYVVTRAERGGAQTQVLELLQSTRGYFEAALATGETGFLTDEAQALGVPVFPVKHLAAPFKPLDDLRAFAELSKIIRSYRPDLIHAHSSKAGILARIAARFHRTPCVFTVHGWAFSQGVSFRRKCLALPAEWLAGSLGAAIITASEFDRDLALRYSICNPDRITTILAAKSDDPTRANPEAGDPPAITMVARFCPQKDHLTLLRALSEVKTPFRLRLAGDGPMLDRARITAEQLGLMSKTDFLGNCSHIADLLSTTQICALISRYEGLPVSILEAMRAGLPVIATDTGGVSEAVRHNWNGLLVERGDYSQVRAAFETLLQNPAMRAEFGRNSRRAFERNFRVETMIERTFALYEQELAPAGHGDLLPQRSSFSRSPSLDL